MLLAADAAGSNPGYGAWLLALAGIALAVTAATGEPLGRRGLLRLPSDLRPRQRMLAGLFGGVLLLAGLFASNALPEQAGGALEAASFADKMNAYNEDIANGVLPVDDAKRAARLAPLADLASNDKELCDVWRGYKSNIDEIALPDVLRSFGETPAGAACDARINADVAAFRYQHGRQAEAQNVPLVTPSDAGASIRGVDVSTFNGDVFWAGIPWGAIQFAYVRATEGNGIVDGRFRANWLALASTSIPRGAYHFYLPSSSPAAQARFFLAHVTVEPGDLPPALDVELVARGGAIDAATQADILTWLEIVERGTNRKPVLYIPLAMTAGLDRKFAAYPLWFPHFSAVTPTPPPPWNRVTVWQFSPAGRLRGVGGPIDLNRFNGTSAELRTFRGL